MGDTHQELVGIARVVLIVQMHELSRFATPPGDVHCMGRDSSGRKWSESSPASMMPTGSHQPDAAASSLCASGFQDPANTLQYATGSPSGIINGVTKTVARYIGPI